MMVLKRQIYDVAGHCFAVLMDESSFVWSRMSDSYGPFVTGSCSGHVLFSVRVNDSVESEDLVLIYSNVKDQQPGFVRLSVFRTSGGYLFEFTQPSSSEVNCRLHIDDGFSKAVLSLHGSDICKWLSFNEAVKICYMMSTAVKDTLLIHASAVRYQGRAYAFLGKSGTGKSTHSRMWLSSLEDVDLINDDHPVLRIIDGAAYVFGSPWSGKTPCYRSVSAPLGGIVRIRQASRNSICRLTPIESYASLMSSTVSMTWIADMADGRDKALQKIVSEVACWTLDCLPDHDAAKICSEAVTVL